MSGGSDTQTTRVENPPWMDQASQNLLGAAGGALSGAQQNPLQTGAYATADMYGQMAPGALGQSYNVMTGNANFQPNYDWLGPLAGMLGGGGGGGYAAGAMGGSTGEVPMGGGRGGPQAAQAQTYSIDPSQLQNVDPHSILDYNVQNYMDPYTSSVIDSSLRQNDQSRQMQSSADAARALGSGAFGGSRSAIVDAATNSQYDQNAQSMIANLNNTAYNNAMGLASSDRDAANQADQFNSNQNYNTLLANAGFGNAGSQFNAGQQNTLTGDQIAANAQMRAAASAAGASMYGSSLNAQNNRLSTMINGALGLGQLGLGADLNAATLRGNTAGQLMNFGQAGMGAQGAAGDAIYSQPFDDLGWYSGVLGNVPHGQSNSSPVYHNRGAGALGGAASGAAMGSQGGPWGTAIGAGVGGLMGYFGS